MTRPDIDRLVEIERQRVARAEALFGPGASPYVFVYARAADGLDIITDMFVWDAAALPTWGRA